MNNLLEKFKNQILSLSELLDAGIKVYYNSFDYIVLISLLTSIPTYILLKILPSFSDVMIIIQQAISSKELFDISNTKYYFYVYILIVSYFKIILIASITYISNSYLLNSKLTFSNVCSISILKSHKLLATLFYYILFISIFTYLSLTNMFWLLPLFYVAVNFCFFPNIVAFSKEWGLRALYSSKIVVSGYFNKVFFILTGIGVLNYGINELLLKLLGGNNNNAVFSFFYVMLKDIFGSFFIVVSTLLFLNIYYYKRTKEYSRFIKNI